MATRKPLLITGVNGVSAGQTATITVPVERRYHSIDLFVTDNGAAAVSKVNEVRLTIDGTLMQRFTGAELLALDAFRLNVASAGNLHIPFSEITRATVLQEEVTAWQLYGKGKFEIAVDFDATATNPTLRLIGTHDQVRLTEMRGTPAREVLLSHPLQILPRAYNPGAGWFDITTIPNDKPIQGIYINSGSPAAANPGDILAFEVYRGNEKVMEGTYLENAALLDPYGYDSSKFTLPIIFDREHQIVNALDCRQLDAAGRKIAEPLPLTVRVQMATAKAIKCLVAVATDDFQ